MDITFVNDTFDLSERARKQTDDIRDYVLTENIDDLWTAFVTDARAAAGLGPIMGSDEADHARAFVAYTMEVDADTLYFEAADLDLGDTKPHSYWIPLGFLFPETREAAKDAQRARYALAAAEQTARRERQAAATHALEWQQYAALAAKLGKTP